MVWVAVRPRFRKFHEDLMLTSDHVDDGLTKARGIAGSLQRSYYPDATGNPPAFLVGSWGKKTQVRPPNDVDMMFELPAEVHARISQRTGNVQSALLQEVRQALGTTYPNTVMRGDGQVVQVQFNTLMIEVVPVFRLQSGQFWMPDTNNGGRWKPVDPNAELNDVDALDRVCNGNVRALCQMMKLWKREQNVPLKSFQIELLVQEFMTSYVNRQHDYYWYDWFVRDFFRFLISKAGGYVFVPGTKEAIALGTDWKYRAERAYEVALSACGWEHADYDVTAGQEWQKVFGSRIPIKVI
ncbi:SMODS domain-containing nucleotidyltransferase [Bosea thiooxidans]|nr:hypothetical protein [Bosea sp. (in: a-proteobacteria)]